MDIFAILWEILGIMLLKQCIQPHQVQTNRKLKMTVDHLHI